MHYFVIRDEKILANCIAVLQECVGCSVEIRPYKRKRSIPQNKLLHSLICIIANHCGYDAEELKTAIKIRFLGTAQKTIAGQKYDVPISTTTLNTAQFNELIDKVYALGSELGVRLPQPGYWGME